MQISTARSRRFTADEAAEIAATHYELDALPEALAGEFDDNFQLTTPSGEYVLKIMRAGPDQAMIRGLVEMQIAVLDRLRDAGCAVPQVAITPRMDAIVEVEGRLVWMLKWLPGKPLADARPRTVALARELGEMLGRIDATLTGFDHPAAHRDLKWDLARASWTRDYVHHIAEGARRVLVERILDDYDATVAPALARVRQGVIHGDANDHNVLVANGAIAGLIDFGDLHHTALVAEPAIAAAYAAFGSDRPLEMIAAVAAGYHKAYPLTEDEIALLFPLVLTRLGVSVTNSAYLKSISLDPYATVSESDAWRALELLTALPTRLPHHSIRHACGLRSEALKTWLTANTATFAPVLEGIDLRTEPCVVFDLSIGSLMLGANPSAIETEALTKTLFAEMSRAKVRVGIGRYDEARALYLTDAFATGSHTTDERRTVHIGLDLFIEPGAAVCAPLDGFVHSFANRAAKCDYGPAIILSHQADGAPPFFTLYGHLSLESLDGLHAGKKIARGERFAWIGAPPINGDWTPHLHFQIIEDLLGFVGDFPGVCLASQREVWLGNSPDPNLITGIPKDTFPVYDVPNGVVSFMREDAGGPSLSLSYREPLQIVRGWRQYLYDETGRAFLDTYNNVPLVGHSHPHVVEAVQRQIALLNTNTRYLHLTMAKYATVLAGACDLDVCYFLNSASEANELAIRMARAYTDREDIIVLEHAYHGHTNTLIDISPYKFDGPGGNGRKPWVHVATMPDDYRGPYKRHDPECGIKYAQRVAAICERTRPAAFIAESLPSVGGQIVLPRGYLREAYKHVHAAGGVCIADEVQVGFGRLGKRMWGYQMQGVKPDIVVLGKPIANGFPLGAVVCAREIAVYFNNGMEFFSTFGGNPVAMAAGWATFEVLGKERLQENALDVGTYWIEKLRALMSKHEIIGDVRGAGLFLGVELVRNLGTLEPAAEEASYVVNRLRERGILTGTDGPHHNVIKLRPPLIFTKDDADFFTRVFDDVLAEDAVTANLS